MIQNYINNLQICVSAKLLYISPTIYTARWATVNIIVNESNTCSYVTIHVYIDGAESHEQPKDSVLQSPAIVNTSFALIPEDRAVYTLTRS